MAPQTLQSNIIFLCGDFTHLFHQVLTRAFREHKIPVTIEQFAVLALLFYQNGINQKDIAALLGRDKATITRIITNMMKNKVIQRVQDKRDGRGKLIFLTPKGEAIQKKAVQVSGKLYMNAVRNINEKDFARTVAVITQMTLNIRQYPKI